MTTNSPNPVRGKLTAKGRDVPRVTIHAELGDDLRFVLTEAPTTALNARGRIIDALERQPASTAQEIATATSIPVNTIKNVLTVMARDSPPTIERTGTGRRDAPYRYSIASRFHPDGTQQDTDGTRPDPPDLNPTDPSPRENGRDDSNGVSNCVTCGAALEPGQRARCRSCMAASYRDAGR